MRSYCELPPLEPGVHLQLKLTLFVTKKQQRPPLAIRPYLQDTLVLHSRSANGFCRVHSYAPIPPILGVFCVHAQLLSGSYREELNRG